MFTSPMSTTAGSDSTMDSLSAIGSSSFNVGLRAWIRLLRDEDEMDDIRLRSRLLFDSFFSSPLSSMPILFLGEPTSLLWRLDDEFLLAASYLVIEAEVASFLDPGLEGVSEPFRDPRLEGDTVAL